MVSNQGALGNAFVPAEISLLSSGSCLPAVSMGRAAHRLKSGSFSFSS